MVATDRSVARNGGGEAKSVPRSDPLSLADPWAAMAWLGGKEGPTSAVRPLSRPGAVGEAQHTAGPDQPEPGVTGKVDFVTR